MSGKPDLRRQGARMTHTKTERTNDIDSDWMAYNLEKVPRKSPMTLGIYIYIYIWVAAPETWNKTVQQRTGH